MQVTPISFLQTIAPHLFDAPSAQQAVGLAELQVPSDVDAKQRPVLVAYYAAHILTVAESLGGAGGVTGKTEGRLSISFAGAGDAKGMATTSYGQEYQRLVRGFRGYPIMLGEG